MTHLYYKGQEALVEHYDKDGKPTGTIKHTRVIRIRTGWQGGKEGGHQGKRECLRRLRQGLNQKAS